MYGNIKKVHIIVTQCDEYSYMYDQKSFYLKCHVLSLLQQKPVNYSDSKGFAFGIKGH